MSSNSVFIKGKYASLGFPDNETVPVCLLRGILADKMPG